MSSTTSLDSLELQELLAKPRDVVGLVEDVLAACPADGLELQWHAGGLRARRPSESWHSFADSSPRLSIFRAMLARLAVLCNECHPNSVSPYGGEGEVHRNSHSIQVAFTNTPSEQILSLRWK